MRKESTKQVITRRIDDLCRNFRFYLERFDSDAASQFITLFFATKANYSEIPIPVLYEYD